MSHIIHLGDCLDPITGMASLPDRSVDHVITDPPYSEHVHRNLGREGRSDGTRERDPLAFGALTEDMAREISIHLARVVRRWILVFSDERVLSAWRVSLEGGGAEFIRTGAWIKQDPMPQMSGDRPGAGLEWISIAHGPRTSGRLRWNGGGRPAIWTFRGQEPGRIRHHPTQKPLALMEALLRDFTDPGETILDPFAGSGTTGVACKHLGRSFVGWERDPKYHAVAERRIRDAREQLEIGMPAAKPRQEVML